MAQKPLSTTAAERMNLVAQDEIWKYRLRAESEARQNWPAKWGYLTTSMKELLEGEEEPQTPKPKPELPSHFYVRPVSPMDKHIKVRKTLFTPLSERKILPSPTVPKTTQGFIGWRSGKPALYCLEKYSEVCSCKGAYARELCWPEQGVH